MKGRYGTHPIPRITHPAGLAQPPIRKSINHSTVNFTDTHRPRNKEWLPTASHQLTRSAAATLGKHRPRPEPPAACGPESPLDLKVPVHSSACHLTD